MKTKRKQWLFGWLISGIVLALGPVWGMIGTTVGMISAFAKVAESGSAQPAALADNVGMALYATFIGYLACPIGLVIIVVTLIKLSKETPVSDTL
jgi:biopolymer transport protein ExbB/TolQ